MIKFSFLIASRSKATGLELFLLLLCCAFPIGVIGQTGEDQNNATGSVKPKLSIYYDTYYSILIEATDGVQLELQGSVDLNIWKRLGVVSIEGGPVMFSPSTTIDSSSYFFRAVQLKETEDPFNGGNTDNADGGSNNPIDSNVGSPGNSFYLNYTHETPLGALVQYTDIDRMSELANSLSKQLLDSVEGEKVRFHKIKSVQKFTSEEQGKGYLVQIFAKNEEGNEYLLTGDFALNENGELQLEKTQVQELVNPTSDQAKRLARLVLNDLSKKTLELVDILAVNKISDNIKMFIFVNLKLRDSQGDIFMAYSEFEDNGNGDPKLIQSNVYGGDDALGTTDPLELNDSNDGIDSFERIEPDSDLGRSFVKAVIAHIEDTGLQFISVTSMNWVKYGDKKLSEAELHAKDAKENQLVVNAVAEQAEDGSFTILNLNITPNNNGGP